MEKKEYIQPVIKVRMMEAATLLAASGDSIDGEMSEGNAGAKVQSIWHWMEED